MDRIHKSASNTAPAAGALSVTPNDSTNLAIASRGLYIGVQGNVAVEMMLGGVVTFLAVPAGTVLPIQVVKVMNTDTTATSIIALY